MDSSYNKTFYVTILNKLNKIFYILKQIRNIFHVCVPYKKHKVFIFILFQSMFYTIFLQVVKTCAQYCTLLLKQCQSRNVLVHPLQNIAPPAGRNKHNNPNSSKALLEFSNH